MIVLSAEFPFSNTFEEEVYREDHASSYALDSRYTRTLDLAHPCFAKRLLRSIVTSLPIFRPRGLSHEPGRGQFHDKDDARRHRS